VNIFYKKEFRKKKELGMGAKVNPLARTSNQEGEWRVEIVEKETMLRLCRGTYSEVVEGRASHLLGWGRDGCRGKVAV